MGDSRKQLSRFPNQTRRQFATALRMVQNGATPLIAKPLAAYGTGVFELRVNTRGETYRVAYLIKLKRGIYVLDAFKKKSKTGKAIPKADIDRLKRRIKDARAADGDKR